VRVQDIREEEKGKGKCKEKRRKYNGKVGRFNEQEGNLLGKREKMRG
jgi:hypothetical protein